MQKLIGRHTGPYACEYSRQEEAKVVQHLSKAMIELAENVHMQMLTAGGGKPCTAPNMEHKSACKDTPKIQLRSDVSADSKNMSKHLHAPSAFIYCIDYMSAMC